MRIGENAWLAALFGDRMTTPEDYVSCSARLRSIMGPHVAELLNAGLSVVLDSPASTVETRAWMREILSRTLAAHQLHVLEMSDDVCLDRLRRRNASGKHPFSVSEDQFHRFSRHYAPPTEDEGFTRMVHRIPDAAPPHA